MNQPDKPGHGKAHQLLDDSLSRLADLVDEKAAGREIRRFLKVCARFHRYSWGNQLLIAMQYPAATRVAGYRTWQKLGRQVNRGEKGIVILVPYRKKVVDDGGDEEETVVGFGTGHVYDISQTSGEPLPEVNCLATGDSHRELYRRLRAFASSLGIEVAEKQHPGSVKGTSSGGRVTVEASESANGKAAILLHELAHEILHKNASGDSDRRVREVEAEATAYVTTSPSGAAPRRS